MAKQRELPLPKVLAILREEGVQLEGRSRDEIDQWLDWAHKMWTHVRKNPDGAEARFRAMVRARRMWEIDRQTVATPCSGEPEGESPTGGRVSRQGDSGKLANLVRHPEGSNGGTRRGPDKSLRINAMRGLFLQALAGEQLRLIVVGGQKRRHRSMVPMAMADDVVAGLQLVARRGAEGKNLKEFLAMVFGIHKAMQPGQHEKNGNGHQPKPATFIVAPPTDPPAEQPPARETAPGTLLGPNGQLYVE